MKKTIILILLSCQILANGQESFQIDSLLSDTVYITKSSGKLYENQTFIDKYYNSLTTRKEIIDTTAYIDEKKKLIENAENGITFIDDNIIHLQKYIIQQKIQKQQFINQKIRYQKLIARLRKKA